METHEFAIAVPTGWERKPQTGPMMVLHVGVDGVDETGQPLRCGLTVERAPGGADAVAVAAPAHANELLRRFREDSSFRIIGEPTVETVRLSDGRDAALLKLQAYRGPDRRTSIAKLVVVRGNLRWVTSAFVTAGRNSGMADLDDGTFLRLSAFQQTFTTDPATFDAAPVEQFSSNSGS